MGLCLGASMYKCVKHQLQTSQSVTQRQRVNPSHKIVQDRQPGGAEHIRLVCIRPLGPVEEITYFYGNRLYVMTGIGPVPACAKGQHQGRSKAS